MAATSESARKAAQIAEAADGIWLRLPDHMRARIVRFFVDNGTGRVVLHALDGQVQKASIEEFLKD